MADSSNNGVAVLDQADEALDETVETQGEDSTEAIEAEVENVDVDIAIEDSAPESAIAIEDDGESETTIAIEEAGDISMSLPTSDDGDEGKSFSEEMTNPDTWVGNSPLKSDYLAIRKQAEDLFGHKLKIMKYVAFMYLVRTVMLKEAKHCLQRGEEFKRADFIKKVRDFLLFTSSIPKGQIEPSPWLQMVGFMELFRATVDDATGRYVFPQSPPDEHFFTGNLCYSTLRALAPLVKVEKVQGATDSYSWVEGGVEVAKDMVKGLRNCSIPNSVSYVIARRDALLEKAQKALLGKKRSAMTDEEREDDIQRELRKLNDARERKLKNAVQALDKVAKENKFDKDTVKSALVSHNLVKPVGTADLVGLMATPENRKVANAALLGNVETRKALIEDLARDCTHQDVQQLFNCLLMRAKANPADQAARLAVAAFETAAKKLDAMRQKKMAS